MSTLEVKDGALTLNGQAICTYTNPGAERMLKGLVLKITERAIHVDRNSVRWHTSAVAIRDYAQKIYREWHDKITWTKDGDKLLSKAMQI